MKDIIINKLFDKISNEFDYDFPPFLSRSDYERQLSETIIHIEKQVNDLKNEYFGKLHSSNIEEFKSLIKVLKEDFINNPSEYFKYSDVLTLEAKEKLYEEIVKSRFNDDKIISLIESSWEKEYYNRDKSKVKDMWLISPLSYISDKKEIILNSSSNNSISKYILDKLLRTPKYSRNNDNEHFTYFLEKGEIRKDMIMYFSKDYEEKHAGFMELLEMSKKYIQREDILPFSTWILNTGHRDFYINHYSKYASTFIVSNTGKKYTFTHSNDGKKIKDVFVNVFILSNNELLKLCIGSTGLLQRTPYLLSKDIQRVDITSGNIVELHMHKHFDPETIIFDTEDEAYQFQKKVTDLREQRRNFNTRK